MEFVGLHAKMYNLDVPNFAKHSKIRVKGIKKSYVQKHVHHRQFPNIEQSDNNRQQILNISVEESQVYYAKLGNLR